MPSHGVRRQRRELPQRRRTREAELAPGVGDEHRALELDALDLAEHVLDFTRRVREPARPARREHELLLLELEHEELEQLPFSPQDVRDVAQRHACSIDLEARTALMTVPSAGRRR